MDGKPAQSPAWTVFVGPGPRLAILPPLLGALRPDPGWEVRRLSDVDELFGPLPPRGRAVLDCDELQREDVGIVSRFVQRNSGWELALTGGDSAARIARGLLAHARVRWMDWPVDVEQLRGLWQPGAQERPAAPRATPGPARPTESGHGLRATPPAPPGSVHAAHLGARRGESAELSEIRSILEGPPAPGEPGPAPALGPHSVRSAAGAPTGGDGLPAYYREQIADLADIAQRLQLSTRALEKSLDAGPDPGGELHDRLGGVGQDVARLLQFTRTLSFLAAPPGTGDQNIDLGGLLEELLGSLAGSTVDAPRYLFRSAPGLTVRSDKLLLVQAFDAMLQLATRCAGVDDVVRVAAHAQASGPEVPEQLVEVRISFPAGPLADLEPDLIVRPYALRRTLPSIGPNALAAAGGIVRGQGGALDLQEIEQGRLTWIARFPAGTTNGRPAAS